MRAGSDIGRDPAVQPPERDRRRREQRLDQRADERHAEQRADRQRDEHVRRERVDRDAAELQPEDRRRRRAARGRDGEGVAQPVAERVALERTAQRRQQQEDRADGGERELKARLEQARGCPGQQHGRPERQEVPAVARPREQPGERGQAAGDAGANDRRLPADSQHVAGDRGDRRHLAERPWDPEQPRQPEHAEREEGDVLPGHGQQVVEPGRLEVGAKLVGETLVLAQHDPSQHRAPLPGQSGGDRLRDVQAKPVGDAGDAAAVSDDAPVAAAEDDVDAATGEPALLVEAVVRAARRSHGRSEREDGALRRRPAERELEQDAFTQPALAEATHLCGHAEREQRRSHRAGRDGDDRVRAPDLGRQEAAVEGVEPRAPPPPAHEAQRQRACGHREPWPRDGGRSQPEQRCARDRGRTSRIREREA